jgi:hypothetical protein
MSNISRFVLAAAIVIAYYIVSYFLIGFKPEQVFISSLFFILYTASKKTRNFILTLMPFVVFWVIFDYMKAFPNFEFNKVHIEDLYRAEQNWFGISTIDGGVQTLNEFWFEHQYTLLDVMSGFFYLCWMPAPIAFATYLFFKNRKVAVQFCLAFLITNFVGFIGYYGYPAAPPWYVAQYGFSFNPNTPGNVAGLQGFDQFVGLPIFHGLYSKSSNVFAAMPSLHSAYVVVSVFFAFKYRVHPAWKLFLVVIMLGTWFAAVYTYHHYVFDALVGVVTAVIGLSLFELLLRTSLFKRFLNGYYAQVSAPKEHR